MTKLLNSPPPGFLDTSILSVDLETTGVEGMQPNPRRDKTLLVSLSSAKRETIVLRPGDWLVNLFNVLDNPDVTILMHNAKFDIKFLTALGYQGRVPGLWDTMLIEQIITAGTGELVNLEATAWRRCSKLVDKTLQKSFIQHAGEFSQAQIDYAGKDAEVLLDILIEQKSQCKSLGLERVAKLENSLVPVVADMEWRGVGFDIDRWNVLKLEELEIANKAEQDFSRALNFSTYQLSLFGEDIIPPINLGSHTQLKQALNDAGINVTNTQEKTLLKYLKKHPDRSELIESITRYTKAMKMASFAYDQKVDPLTGRIHTHYGQARARTGRFSSSGPNLQNVSKQKKYRALFVAAPGCVLATYDYAQQEMRILAFMSGDQHLRELCLSTDFHLEMARVLYNDRNIVKSDPRRFFAKCAGFAMVYGATAETVAETVGIKIQEARPIVRGILESFPCVTEWANEQCNKARREGWVSTLSGRRRWFTGADEDPNLATGPRNTPIQGSAADMLKESMVEIFDSLRDGGYKAGQVLTVHDEIVVEISEHEKEEVVPLVEQKMVDVGQRYLDGLPTPVDYAVAREWRK